MTSIILRPFLLLLAALGLSRTAPVIPAPSLPVPVADAGSAGGAILPLAVGNSWSYRVVAMGRLTDSVSYSVVGTKKIPGGREVFLFNREWLLDKDAVYLLDGALYGLKAERAPRTIEMLIPGHPKPGRRWLADYGARFRFVGHGDTVKVRAGSFLCDRIDVVRPRSGSPLRFTMWWSPGVGLVKVEGENIDMELLAYSVR